VTFLERQGVGRVRRELARTTWRTVVSPPNFLPRLDRIRGQSYKVLVTDATRYLTDDGLLDFDISNDPGVFGSFLVNTPIWTGAREWRRSGSGYAGHDNLSIRHSSNSVINASFFDGSTGTLTRREIYGEPKHWHPRGAEFVANDATDESIANYEPGDRVD